MGLTKYCRCGKTIPIRDKSCKECEGYYDAQYAKYNKKYDNTKRAHADFYDSQEWKELRAIVKGKYKGLDIYDYYINNKLTHANTAHHIIEIREDYSRRLDIDNLIPLSGANHSKIHKMYFRSKRKTQELLLQLLEQAKRDGIG